MSLTSCRRVVGSLMVALSLFLASSSGTARSQVKKSDSTVKATAVADKPDADGKQTVTVTLNIEKGWHLYANPVGNEDFVPAQTVVQIGAKVKPVSVKVAYPAGKVVVDAVTGNYKVYDGKVEIKAQVKRAKDDTSALEISVKVQACDDKKCLLPATIKITAP
jgi:uncharacterized protein